MSLIRIIVLSLFVLACAPDRLSFDFDGGLAADHMPSTALEAATPVDAPVDVPATARDAGSTPPDGPRTTFPPLRVFVSPDWTLEQRVSIEAAFVMLRPVLPEVVDSNMALADLGIYVTRAANCDAVAGGTFSRTAYLDPRCFPTRAGFDITHAVAHLVLDFLGLSHICVRPDESATDCSPVPSGMGVMNVHFAEGRTPARVQGGWSGGLSPFDMAEARRVIALVPR
jgi:hypothetical protein